MDTILFNYLYNFASQSGFLTFFIIYFCAKYLWGVLVLGFAVILFFDKRQNWKQKTHWLFDALLAGGLARLVVAEVIRYFYHHPRPSGAAMFLETSYSFPSGHVIFIFAFTTIVYFYNKKLGWWFGILGLLIGLARVAAGVHWPSDILGGIILGIITGWATYSASIIIRRNFKVKS